MDLDMNGCLSSIFAWEILFSVFAGLAWAPGVGSRDGYVVSTR